MANKTLEITDGQIAKAFEFTNFGPHMKTVTPRRRSVARAVLKLVCDYGNGSTMTCILQELGITKTLGGNPTKAARRWMYDQLK